MEANAFASLGKLCLQTPGRLFPNSCCPDKDLVLLSSRLGGTDRMSLWNLNQCSKIWESEVGTGTGNCTVSGIAWSPDGQSIAVIQDPPAISVHSVQDGRCFLNLPLLLNTKEEQLYPLTGVWWFEDNKDVSPVPNIPDILPRNGYLAGSALSVLKILPLLDSLRKEDEGFTATDVFAFQGSHTKASQKTRLPHAIEQWPTLTEDPVMASINPPSSKARTMDYSGSSDAQDRSDVHSIMLVVDSSGRLFSYLDGTFSLGYFMIGPSMTCAALTKYHGRCLFIAQSCQDGEHTPILMDHIVIDLPLLSKREARDFAKLATAGRALMHYSMRVVKEMREAWFGSDSNSGARDFGPKWIKTLEMKQKDQFGESGTNPILDLTYLLTTGRASDALSDLLGSGEQTSDRGLQKWESTVVDALTKLRDSSEKRVAPALQRLHLILEELQGWAQLPQYLPFRLDSKEIESTIELVGRGIIIAGWLAASARRERANFRQFIQWLRFEVNILNAPNDANVPRHDLLEVNQYFASGLSGSRLDAWFLGPVPRFNYSVDIGIKDYKSVLLSNACEEALKATESFQLLPQKYAPMGPIHKNIEALIADLAAECQQIFHQGSGATSRSGMIGHFNPTRSEVQPKRPNLTDGPLPFPFRERTALGKDGKMIQHLIAPLPSAYRGRLLLSKIQLVLKTSEIPVPSMQNHSLEIALLQVSIDDEETNIDILDAGFFDDEIIVIVYRNCDADAQTYIATVKYDSDHVAGYQKLSYGMYVNGFSREDLMQSALDLWKNEQLPTTCVAIDRRHALSRCKTGSVTLALNGRTGRRVACVLDYTGTNLESFDLEGDAEEDMEEADDARAEYI